VTTDDPCECRNYVCTDSYALGYLMATGHHVHCPDHGNMRTRHNSSTVIDLIVAKLDSALERAEKAERERDALMEVLVRPVANGPWQGAWRVTHQPLRDPLSPCFYPTREAAVAAVRKAAGLEDAE
jgi:hypothetical protein